MSWLYSRALVEASSAGTYLDGELSVQLSGSPTPLAFLSHGKTTDFSRLSRFGVTFRPLMDDLGEELLMSYLAGFHAKTSASLERAQASAANDPGCGPTWRGSLARFDPSSCSWKTVQLSLLGDLELSSVIWPRSGMTANGQCWELPMLEPRTSATDSGLWPTPVASDTSSRTKPYAQGGTPLSLAVKWPTPTVCGNHNRKGASPTSGDGLATAVARYPTPSTIGINGGSHSRAAALKRGQSSAELNGGSLNPTWVEWLMGWPLGWTDLKPLATDKCRSVPLKRGES